MAAGTIRREKGRDTFPPPEYVDCGLKRRGGSGLEGMPLSLLLPADRGYHETIGLLRFFFFFFWKSLLLSLDLYRLEYIFLYSVKRKDILISWSV